MISTETTTLLGATAPPSRTTTNASSSYRRMAQITLVCGALLIGALLFSSHYPAEDPPEEKDIMVMPRLMSSHTKHKKHHHQKKKHHQHATTTTRRRYTATQFISFSISTMGGVAARGECDGLVVDAATGTCYLGDAHNMTHDIAHRVDIIAHVLDAILRTEAATAATDDDTTTHGASANIDHSNTTLKIVMFPEFFLRGPHGAYELEHLLEDGALLDMAERIGIMVRDVAFTNYLFVLGTVIAASTPTPLSTATTNLTQDEVEYFNFAPVYVGGPPHEHDQDDNHETIHSNMLLVTKQYISGADFLDRVTLPDPVVLESETAEYYYDPLPAPFLQLLRDRQVQLETDNLFELDGVRIGLEICLDHRKGALWETLQANREQQNDSSDDTATHDTGALVDVQLITSAGMSIERGPNPIVPGGVVYLTDGEDGASAACVRTTGNNKDEFDPDHVCREPIQGVKHLPPVAGTAYSHFVPLSACVDVNAAYDGYYSLHQPQGCAHTLSMYGIQVLDEYKRYPPSLDVYPVIDLPPLRKD